MFAVCFKKVYGNILCFSFKNSFLHNIFCIEINTGKLFTYGYRSQVLRVLSTRQSAFPSILFRNSGSALFQQTEFYVRFTRSQFLGPRRCSNRSCSRNTGDRADRTEPGGLTTFRFGLANHSNFGLEAQGEMSGPRRHVSYSTLVTRDLSFFSKSYIHSLS